MGVVEEWDESTLRRCRTAIKIEHHIFDLPRGCTERHRKRRNASYVLLCEIQMFITASIKTIITIGNYAGQKPVQDVRPIGEELTWRISGFVRSDLKPNRALRNFLTGRCMQTIKDTCEELDDLFERYEMQPITTPNNQQSMNGENHVQSK